MMADAPDLNLPTSPKDAHAKAAANGQELHDQKGRFTTGNPGAPKGPGRPKGRPNYWTELKGAIRRYKTRGGKKFFDKLIDKALESDKNDLASTLLDKLFDDATIPKGIDLTMIQGVGSMESVVKGLAEERRTRLAAAGESPETEEPEEP